MSTTPDVDVLIVGAGVSGIGIACHLAIGHPERSVAILERRDRIGGTWDLFRYPGIRCDSDMNTFGYAFRPWPQDRIITDGESIRTYVRETAEAYGVDRTIRFGQRVTRASWSTEDGHWTVESVDEHTGETSTTTARFAVSCTGYYDYDRGHLPDFPGVEDYRGTFVHPQFWPEDLDHTGKKVLVIGSGATAVTLIPAMAEDAEQVTMLQRSPTYIVSIPEVDHLSSQLKKVLPDEFVANLARYRNLVIQLGMYYGSKAFPSLVRRGILAAVKRQVGPEVPLRHFSPDYDPWDERLCVVPNGDLFHTLRRGDATVVTDTLETFTENGVRLPSGEEIEADIVISATGLEVQLLGGITAEVDGQPVDATDRMTYKAIMVDGVPNFALVFGYVNVSWTRKVDLVGHYLNQLFDHMDRVGRRVVTPRGDDEAVTDEPFVGLSSGYVTRAMDRMPHQGARAPWRNTQNLVLDWLALRLLPIDDGHLDFSQPVEGAEDHGLRGTARRAVDVGIATAAATVGRTVTAPARALKRSA